MSSKSPATSFMDRSSEEAVASSGASQASLSARISAAYGAQLVWRQQPIKERLAKLNALRTRLVQHRIALAQAIAYPSREGFSETLTAEIMPLADSIAWLYKRGRRVLKPRYSRARLTPLWLGAIRSTVYREPFGVVLIIGASNYPLFLTGVQVTQALAAGNAVVIKPAPGAEQVTRLFVELAVDAGVPKELLIVLGSDPALANQAMEIGVDKVLLTGSSATGRAVLKNLIPWLTPATMELSGCDAVYVLPGADLQRVCKILLFGMRLNGGATCMAPRRVFVTQKASEVFHRMLQRELTGEHQKEWSTVVPYAVYQKLYSGVEKALHAGATYFESRPLLPPAEALGGAAHGETPATVRMNHLVLSNVGPEMELCSADIFAPLLMIVPVEDWADALQADSQSPYALAASIYGPTEDALRLATYISAGVITINDTIVPTADPQTPFGGCGESGFGVTQGDEGLLEMTHPKVISVRRGSWLPHLKPLTPADSLLLEGVLQLNHSQSWKGRWAGIRQMFRAILALRRDQKSH